MSGGQCPEVSVWRADGCSDLCSSQILGELMFLLVTNTFFRWKCEEESVGQAGGRRFSMYSCGIFSSYQLPKTVTVTTLLLFGPVMLLCGTFLCISLSEGPVQLSD